MNKKEQETQDKGLAENKAQNPANSVTVQKRPERDDMYQSFSSLLKKFT